MNKILIIVGVNGSLGKGASNVLLNRDYDKIYLCDRKPINWVEESDSIKKITIKDMSNNEYVEALFKDIQSNAGDTVYLFSTIGGFYSETIDELEQEKLDLQFNINTKSAFLLAKHFQLFCKNKAGGSICFTSARTAEKPAPGKSVYGASKAALEYMVRSLALEWKSKNLTLNCISPIALDTPKNREWVDDKTILASPEMIGEKVHELFEKYPNTNGEIVKVPVNIE